MALLEQPKVSKCPTLEMIQRKSMIDYIKKGEKKKINFLTTITLLKHQLVSVTTEQHLFYGQTANHFWNVCCKASYVTGRSCRRHSAVKGLPCGNLIPGCFCSMCLLLVSRPSSQSDHLLQSSPLSLLEKRPCQEPAKDNLLLLCVGKN